MWPTFTSFFSCVPSQAELMGNMKFDDRERLWREKRVFYCTPQTMANDIRRSICDPSRVVCIVIDGAYISALFPKWPSSFLSSFFFFQKHFLKTLSIVFGK